MPSFCTVCMLPAVILIYHSSIVAAAASANETDASSSPECDAASFGACYNRREAMRLKIIAIFAILAASMVGVCLPLFSRSVHALRPDGNLFIIVKAFASGVILATGYMHVLPDSFADLQSPCLPEDPWHKFPFTTFAAMLAAVFTMMVDSLMLTFYNRRIASESAAFATEDDKSPANGMPVALGDSDSHGHVHCSLPQVCKDDEEGGAVLTIKRNRVIAQVLEMGIIVHSVIIGLSMGASQNPCTINPLVTAICFHQLFEGMGLGGCILQAEYGLKMKAALSFFFATTTPFGIALGIGLSSVYSQKSPTSLVVVGLLNGVSAGILNYTALVDLLASDFMGAKLQGNVKLQMFAFMAVLFGAGGMSLMAKWA